MNVVAKPRLADRPVRPILWTIKLVKKWTIPKIYLKNHTIILYVVGHIIVYDMLNIGKI